MNYIYLIVGRSGTGKSTVADILANEHGYKVVQSYTDREPRYDGEKGHIFVSKDEFDRMMETQNVVAYTFFDGHQYGVTEDVVNENDIYIIDPRGVETMRERYKGPKKIEVILLYAPVDILEKRMKERGDSAKSIKSRLSNDAKEFKNVLSMGFYDISFNTQLFDAECVAYQIHLYIQCCEEYALEGK